MLLPKKFMSGAFKRDLPPTPKFGLLLPELRRMRSHFHAAEAISSPMFLFTLGPMRIAFLCQRIQIEMVVPGMLRHLKLTGSNLWWCCSHSSPRPRAQSLASAPLPQMRAGESAAQA